MSFQQKEEESVLARTGGGGGSNDSDLSYEQHQQLGSSEHLLSYEDGSDSEDDDESFKSANMYSVDYDYNNVPELLHVAVDQQHQQQHYDEDNGEYQNKARIGMDELEYTEYDYDSSYSDDENTVSTTASVHNSSSTHHHTHTHTPTNAHTAAGATSDPKELQTQREAQGKHKSSSSSSHHHGTNQNVPKQDNHHVETRDNSNTTTITTKTKSTTSTHHTATNNNQPWVSIQQQTDSKNKHNKKHQSSPLQINSLTFNQDKTCLAYATNRGFRIRTIPPPQSSSTPLRVHQIITQNHQQQSTQAKLNNNNNNTNPSASHYGISHIQILHSTSLLTVVYTQTPRILTFLHAHIQNNNNATNNRSSSSSTTTTGAMARVVKEVPFTSAIRRIEMNRMMICVLTADGYLHLFLFIPQGSSATTVTKKTPTTDMNDDTSKSTATATGSVSGGGGGIVFVKKIYLLNAMTESARMFTAKPASTSGAFFDLSDAFILHNESTTTPTATTTTTTPSLSSQLSSSSERVSWLVTKSSDGIGMVSLYKVHYPNNIKKGNDNNEKQNIADGGGVTLMNTFCAHAHGIVRITIGGSGSGSGSAHSEEKKQKNYFVATASLQGTVIRVFRLPTCEKLYDLQRGSSPCTIFSMSFNRTANRLAVSSSKGTIHLFHLEWNDIQNEDNNDNDDEGLFLENQDQSSLSNISSPSSSTGRTRSSKKSWSTTMTELKQKIKHLSPFNTTSNEQEQGDNGDNTGTFTSPRNDSIRSSTSIDMMNNTSSSTNTKPIRSYARVRKVRPERIITTTTTTSSAMGGNKKTTNSRKKSIMEPNTIALLHQTRGHDAAADGYRRVDGNSKEEEEEHLVVCSESGKLYQFAVRNDGKSRPVQSENMV